MTFVIADHVSELSTTTGTSAFSLSGVSDSASVRFSSKCAVGDMCFYGALAVDASGNPTGEWENGIGTYSATNTLTRTQVLSSSNSDSAVSFSAGTKQVFITMPAAQVSWARERLTSARTYYVATTGDDSNNGLSAGTPFLTIQKAVDVASSIDMSTFQVTIQVADGTYTQPVVAKRTVGSLPIIIKGNNSTPANVHINVTGTCFLADGPDVYISVMDLKLSATVYGLWSTSGAKIDYQNIDFGACSRHVNAQNYGTIICTGNYSISGGAVSHIGALGGTVQVAGRTVTITGTPAFSVAYAIVGRVGLLIAFSNTYSGSATGARYSVTGNSVIDANGGATTLLPGDAVGTEATGGRYV